MLQRDNVRTLTESGKFLRVAQSLNSATSSSRKVLFSSGKCFSVVGFNERRNHRQSQTSLLCPNGLLTNVVKKLRMGLHKRPLNSIDAYTVRCRYRSDFIIHLHNFNCPSCRCVLAPSLIHSFAFILLRSRHCMAVSYGVLLVYHSIALETPFPKEGRKVRSGYLPFRTNESTLPITPERSSSRGVGTSSYRYPTITYSPASVSANRRTNDTIFVASMKPSSLGKLTPFLYPYTFTLSWKPSSLGKLTFLLYPYTQTQS
ncbi:hypothetical protein TNCV_1533001 [Trichonephila clavipes]|nr:hypothetical protein TNCV_1533001 [Trichonephila clavipes]